MDGNLSNHFLVAAPGLQNEVFSRSVVYIYQQNEEGTVGFIINKPLQVKAENILPQLSIDFDQRQMKDVPIFLGGPISPDQGLILYEKAFDQTEPQVMISNKNEINSLPNEGKSFLIILGHSFWEPGELEAQIENNDWLVAPFKRDIFFSKEIAAKWNLALASIGVSISSYSEVGGHG